jgi:hypothetical protein
MLMVETVPFIWRISALKMRASSERKVGILMAAILVCVFIGLLFLGGVLLNTYLYTRGALGIKRIASLDPSISQQQWELLRKQSPILASMYLESHE